MMSKKVPGKANRKEDLIMNEWSIKAMRALKQARRAEQLLYRSEAMEGKEQSKKEQYMKLNREAPKLMRKNVDRKNEWEEDLKKKMKQIIERGKADIMETLAIKRAAGKYHDENVKQKRKAMMENEKVRTQMYKAKYKGQ